MHLSKERQLPVVIVLLFLKTVLDSRALLLTCDYSPSKQAMHDHPDAWPFKEPVDSRDVPDYYDIIRDPMGKELHKLVFC